ncbi:GatB/YqeY domain-containing protein [Acidipila sp. EB88]|uniref:GatB/YqeY domain-containing protein n=1 Tax=Acidipila sp. EB88 TaxID=2305226 RepID=UPI000F5F00B6|nr:GatB/YqeY domain-containing protein [Acidipila sp. EB88]RRA48075.1 GatB/YqeY domain-containing protein [Acidipila sp. EB88]
MTESVGEVPVRAELVKRIDTDVVGAMKARNSVLLETLRMVKAALKNREIDKREPLTEAEAQATLTTLIKQRRESIEQFTKGGRPELAEKEAAEITMIEAYLPQAVGEAELKPLIAGVLAELAAGGMLMNAKAMGPAMKAVNDRVKELQLRVDGRQVSEFVKAGLAEPAS